MNIDTQILLWAIGSGFSITFILMGIIWKTLDNVQKRLLAQEMNMVEVKTILRMKECCMIQDDRNI